MQHGFTLVELLVVIVVMGLLAGIAVPSFVSFSTSQTLSAAGADLVNTLQTAKAYAASNVKPGGCGPDTLLNYNVNFPASSDPTNLYTTNSYTLDAICKNSSGITDPPITLSSKTVTGVTFSVSTGTNRPLPFWFSFFSIGSRSSLPTIGSITLTNTADGSTRIISVNAQGVISLQ